MTHDPAVCGWCSRPPQWARPRDVAILLGRPVKTVRQWMQDARTSTTEGPAKVNYWEIRCRDERTHHRPNRKGRKVA